MEIGYIKEEENYKQIRRKIYIKIKEISDDSSLEAEFNKFNIYFAKDVNIEGNTAVLNESSEITFASGNTYGFNNVSNCIYLSNNEQQIVLLRDINSCVFSIDKSTGKTVISVTILFKGTTRAITKEYTLVEGNNMQQNEESYITRVY